jgi:hypothetical protein
MCLKPTQFAAVHLAGKQWQLLFEKLVQKLFLLKEYSPQPKQLRVLSKRRPLHHPSMLVFCGKRDRLKIEVMLMNT